jgi:hypothetical protein
MARIRRRRESSTKSDMARAYTDAVIIGVLEE